MVAITCTADVALPPEEVFAYTTDPARFSEWQHNVLGGRVDGPGRTASARGVSPPGESGSPSATSLPR